MTQNKRGLGKSLGDMGLTELLRDLHRPPLEPISPRDNLAENKEPTLKNLPVDRIQPGRYQPRRQWSDEALEELANSIRSQGIIQPIVVRPMERGYEIIAGERRWRAAQKVGLHEIPAVIRHLSDEAAVAMSLIENIQRQNLNAIEEALALQRLIDEFGMTHQEVAEAIGKSRVSVTNILRLLKLNLDVRALVESGKLDMGHARALVVLEGIQQSEVAKKIVSAALSVRDTEKLIRQRLLKETEKHSLKKVIDPDIASLSNALSDKIGAVVVIHHGEKGKGKLTIHYHSVDELEGILARIK